jgi:hypothetical protein
MERPFVYENREQRIRLKQLASRLTEKELGTTMWEGWTVASALAHLAFWDQRALVLMKKWRETGVSPNPIDDDVTNDALLPTPT